MSNHHAHGGHAAPHPKTPPSPFVEVTFVFRDVLKHPIAGLAVQVKAGAGAPPAPEWKIGLDKGDSAPAALPVPASGSSAPVADSPRTAAPSTTAPSNSTQTTTDRDGYAVTINNASRNQPIDVLVKNRRGEYVWKATVTPTKDISAFTVVSPEYHLEATTKLTPRDELEQNIDLPTVKDGEVMTIERLVHDFGPYIGWSQKVTEQGKVKKDIPTRKKETVVDEKTKENRTQIIIEHHYKVVDTGKPKTIAFNFLGSRLNYPKPSTFSEEQYRYMATQLNVEIAAIKAIVMQECSGIPFEVNGLPKIRYERHRFYALLKARHEAQEAAAVQAAHRKGQKKKATPFKNPYPQFPDLCFLSSGGYGDEGLHQYAKLTRAAALDFDLAIQACSWGGFQILADTYAACGCATSFEFANKFMSGSDGQMHIFVLFMKNVKIQGIAALRAHDWEGVASAYNGAYWQDSNPDYAINLRAFYEKFR